MRAGYGIILAVVSLIAIGINATIYQYPGNNYFPPDAFYIGFTLLLLYAGCCIQSGRSSPIAQCMKVLIYFYTVMACVALATNAVQYTPFYPIDKNLLDLEQFFGIHMEGIVGWTHRHPDFKWLLTQAYDSLPYQLSCIPLLVISAIYLRHPAMNSVCIKRLHDFYSLLLISTLIGFVGYYFFPTTGPASHVNSPYFTPSQHATGLKFYQIHHHIRPTTNEGGLIALPSYHVIWGLACLYLIAPYRIAFYALLPVTLLLILACVLLGWHYPIDIFAGFAIFAIALRFCNSPTNGTGIL